MSRITTTQLTKPILYIGIGFIFALLLTERCEKKDKIVVPEVKGSFKTDTVYHTKIDTLYLTKIKARNNEKELQQIQILYNENEALKKAYIDSDSLQRELMYYKSIQPHEYYKHFEDDNIEIMTKGIVFGEDAIKTMETTYTIKERLIDAPTPEELQLRILIGGGLGINKDINQGLYKINLCFQGKRGNMLQGSYMKLNGQDYGILEYNIKLFVFNK